LSKTVIGVFSSHDQAEKAVSELRNKGFEKEISILAKEEKSYKGTDKNTEMFGGDSLSDGATTGGVIGGIAGLAIGAGTYHSRWSHSGFTVRGCNGRRRRRVG